jgi:exodeoxyribonuclease V alpha subunit
MSRLDALHRDGWLRAVDHALALGLRRLRPDSDDAVLVGAALASRALAFGHGALPLAQAAALFVEIAPEREPPSLPELAAWRSALDASIWVARPDARASDPQGATPLVFDGERLYLRRYFDYERRLARALAARAEPDPAPLDAAWCEARLATLFPALAQDPADVQAEAARRSLRRRLLLLSGGPGTGKTTTVARVLILKIEEALRRGLPPPRIALAAPTGKAAARLVEALRETIATLDPAPAPAADVAAVLPREARTLHRLLGLREDDPAPKHDADRPLPFDLVVVDEASMVDLPLMTKLLEAIAPDASLLLVGDPDQLPSVETGDVLAVLDAVASQGGMLADHRVALTRRWRQQAELEVGALADQVRHGEAGAALSALRGATLRGVRWIEPGERPLAAPLREFALPALRAIAQAPDPREGLRRARALRVLTAVREGPHGSVALNTMLAQALRPAGTRPGALFHGALVIVTQNSYRHGLYNGDIGLAWRELDAGLRVWFERDDGDDASRDADTIGGGDAAPHDSRVGLRAWLPAALPAHEPAFALTVHKSQGSEFDAVVLVLPPAIGGFARALSREGLYTGLTRARRELVLLADADALRLAIGRRAQRWSGLAQRLLEA